MRLFLWLLALMAAAIGIAVTARFNPGNVVLFYPPHRIDLSLNFFVVIEVALFAVLYLAIRAFRATIKMPGRVAAYRLRKRERDGNKGLRDALKALFEGRFGHAEKAALRAADLPENAGVAALIGARAAHRMRQTDRRDNWLFELRNDPSMKTARLMTMTELLVDDHQPEAALEAVRELNASGTRHIHALQWSLKAQQQAKNWPEVLRLVRSLDKHRALHPALAARLVDGADGGPHQALRGQPRGHRAERARPARRGAPGGRGSLGRELGRAGRARLPRGGGAGRFAGAAGADRALRGLDQRASDRRRAGADARFAVPEAEAVGQGAALSGAGAVRR